MFLTTAKVLVSFNSGVALEATIVRQGSSKGAAVVQPAVGGYEERPPGPGGPC